MCFPENPFVSKTELRTAMQIHGILTVIAYFYTWSNNSRRPVYDPPIRLRCNSSHATKYTNCRHLHSYIRTSYGNKVNTFFFFAFQGFCVGKSSVRWFSTHIVINVDNFRNVEKIGNVELGWLVCWKIKWIVEQKIYSIVKLNHLCIGPLLLTWCDWNSGMEYQFHAFFYVGCSY